jgi:hypothetical protein
VGSKGEAVLNGQELFWISRDARRQCSAYLEWNAQRVALWLNRYASPSGAALPTPGTTKVADLGRMQPVPEGQKDHGGVAVAITVASRGFHEPLDLIGARCSRVLSSAFLCASGELFDLF